MPTPRLDAVFNYNLDELEAFLAAFGPDDFWPVAAMAGEGSPVRLHQLIRSALRADVDALLVRPQGALDDEVAELLGKSALTGHAVLLCDAEPADVERLRAAMPPGTVGFETGEVFFGRLPEGAWRVRLDYQDLEEAPLPEDLTEGCDRYETVTGDRDAALPAPAAVGDRLRLKVVKLEPNDWEPAGTVEIVPVTADGDSLGAIARGAVPPAEWQRIDAATAKVTGLRRLNALEETPDLCAHRILLDVPQWMGALVAGASGYRALSRQGRQPVVTLVKA